MITEKRKRNPYPNNYEQARKRAIFASSMSSAKRRNKPVTLAPVNIPKERKDER